MDIGKLLDIVDASVATSGENNFDQQIFADVIAWRTWLMPRFQEYLPGIFGHVTEALGKYAEVWSKSMRILGSGLSFHVIRAPKY